MQTVHPNQRALKTVQVDHLALVETLLVGVEEGVLQIEVGLV